MHIKICIVNSKAPESNTLMHLSVSTNRRSNLLEPNLSTIYYAIHSTSCSKHAGYSHFYPIKQGNSKHIMVNKSFLQRYSRGERVALSGLFLVLACCLTWIAFNLLQTTWQGYLLDQRFEREGVQTEGVVSGFRYVRYTGRYAHLSSGEYPIVSIDTPKGAFQILSSYEYPLTKRCRPIKGIT